MYPQLMQGPDPQLPPLVPPAGPPRHDPWAAGAVPPTWPIQGAESPAPPPFSFMRPSSAPLPTGTPTWGYPFQAKAHWQMFGDSAGGKCFYQNRRMYLANGRMLSREELADQRYEYVPHELRQAIAEDMAKPPPEPPRVTQQSLFDPEQQQSLTAEERLRLMDNFVQGPQANYRDFQAKGIIVRQPV